MNNLVELYLKIKGFAEDHNMVSGFSVLKNEQDISTREFDYKQLLIIPSEANISRDLNTPVYTLDFGCIVIDRIDMEDDLSYVSIVQENLFIIGQLQDYLIQEGYDVNFEDVDISSGESEDYNISAAICDFSVVLVRKPYLLNIDM
jgi:hypothetical protein